MRIGNLPQSNVYESKLDRFQPISYNKRIIELVVAFVFISHFVCLYFLQNHINFIEVSQEYIVGSEAVAMKSSSAHES